MSVQVLQGDCRDVLKTLPDESVHCVVTSPPYWGLRDYGVAGQIGLEKSPDDFVRELVGVFEEIRRVLKSDGTAWLNLGDSYGHGTSASRQASKTSTKVSAEQHIAQGARHGGMAKQLIGIPWRVAFALQAAGWYLRQDIIWSKPNPMPESVRDRCTKSHEYLFLLSKSERYYYDAEAISEPSDYPELAGKTQRVDYRPEGTIPDVPTGAAKVTVRSETRNKRSVWTVTTHPFKEAHFATFPPALIEPCILAGCPEGGTVLDPFGGAGTTGLVADRHGRDAILIELNPEYADMARRRITNDAPLFAEVS